MTRLSSSDSRAGDSRAGDEHDELAERSAWRIDMSAATASCAAISVSRVSCAIDSATVGFAPARVRCRLFWNHTWICRGETRRRAASSARTVRPGHLKEEEVDD